jgi:hypothetical protein
MVQVAEPYIGKYFSQDYVRRKILRQTDIEIIEQDSIIKKEIQKGIIPDPNQPIDPQTGLPLDQTSQMNLGQPSLTEGISQTPIPSILDETQDKNQTIMDGAPIGGGANSLKGLPKNPSNDPDIDIIRDQYPLMQVWASMPGTSRQTAEFVNYLGQII